MVDGWLMCTTPTIFSSFARSKFLMLLYEKYPVYLTNSLSRNKEKFEPITPGHVGIYLCGPTVYGDPHLGHARSAISFDIVNRYFRHLGYKVRYVRNITDVGHLENDADEGEDKILKKARIEQLEPMQVVQLYTNSYRHAMQQLNVLPPISSQRQPDILLNKLN